MVVQAGCFCKGKNIRVVLFEKSIIAGDFIAASLNVLPLPVGQGDMKGFRLAAIELAQHRSLGGEYGQIGPGQSRFTDSFPHMAGRIPVSGRRAAQPFRACCVSFEPVTAISFGQSTVPSNLLATSLSSR